MSKKNCVFCRKQESNDFIVHDKILTIKIKNYPDDKFKQNCQLCSNCETTYSQISFRNVCVIQNKFSCLDEICKMYTQEVKEIKFT